jgi:hypothetical protein
VQSKVTYVVTDGHVSMTGGALSPFGWAVLLVATVVAGRLWYVIPRLRRR